MEITKSQKRLFIILGIVIVIAAGDFLINTDQYLSFYGNKQTTSGSSSQKKASAQTDDVKNSSVQSYNKDWAYDPFAESVKAPPKRIINPVTKSEPDIKLEAISYVKNRTRNSMAMINGSFLKVGDHIYGYTLISIKVDQVILAKDSGNLVLKLDNY